LIQRPRIQVLTKKNNSPQLLYFQPLSPRSPLAFSTSI